MNSLSLFRSARPVSSLLASSSSRTSVSALQFSPSTRFFSKKSHAVSIHERMHELVPEMRKQFTDLKKRYGDLKLGSVTVGSAIGGMRGLHSILCETSLLDENEGIRFRGYTIPECQKLLPKAPGGSEPLPEGLLWLLLTGEIPTQAQVANLTAELIKRSALPPHVRKVLDTLPSNMHPMTQLITAVCALQTESKFAKAYQEGTINKQNYWQPTLEDSLDLIARLPEVAAVIYRNTFHNRQVIAPNHKKFTDMSSYFAHMLGFDNHDFIELMRLYLTIHTDHEGGNVSAHATHLVGSALADPYLSYAAGMAGLAGPLHGLANQEVLRWILKFREQFGSTHPTKEQLEKACWDTLNKGSVIPGYGHAVLRKTDPRYTCQREFALKHLPSDPLFRLVSDLYEVVPKVLTAHGKTKNPFPNVDAHSGVLLQHYGLKEQDYYTVLFGVSRGIGVLSSLVIDRVLGMPIERPKSITSSWIKKHFGDPPRHDVPETKDE